MTPIGWFQVAVILFGVGVSWGNITARLNSIDKRLTRLEDAHKLSNGGK